MAPISIAHYTLLEVRRNRLIWAYAIAGLAGFVIAEFAAAVAITESTALSAAAFAAVLRLASVALVAFYVISSIARESADRGLYVFLAMAISRGEYLCGKFLGFSCAAIIAAAMSSLPLASYADPLQVLFWGISLALELIIVVAMSLLCALSLGHPASALFATFGFYLMARTIRAIELMTHGPFSDAAELSQRFVNELVHIIAFVLPSLDQFGSSHWLIYGTGTTAQVLALLGQAMVYIVLMLVAAAFDFHRRNL